MLMTRRLKFQFLLRLSWASWLLLASPEVPLHFIPCLFYFGREEKALQYIISKNDTFDLLKKKGTFVDYNTKEAFLSILPLRPHLSLSAVQKCVLCFFLLSSAFVLEEP